MEVDIDAGEGKRIVTRIEVERCIQSNREVVSRGDVRERLGLAVEGRAGGVLASVLDVVRRSTQVVEVQCHAAQAVGKGATGFVDSESYRGDGRRRGEDERITLGDPCTGSKTGCAVAFSGFGHTRVGEQGSVWQTAYDRDGRIHRGGDNSDACGN